MMAELIDRKALKAEVRELLRSAQASPKAVVALYLGLNMATQLIKYFAGGSGILSTFLDILFTFFMSVLMAGFVMYCMTIRRSERAEISTLFDGFNMVGKIILLEIVQGVFIFLWSMLLLIPGLIAMYRYQFALYNLIENPDIGIMDAIRMSKQQTMGYKAQLFTLDLSYLGWTLLAALPAIVELVMLYRGFIQLLAIEDPYTLYFMSEAELLSMAFGGVPFLAVLLFTGLWSLVVSLFYYPNMICVELGYFEIAKRTSGVGLTEEDQTPRLDDGWNGL